MSFARRDSLKQHTETVHEGIKNFACEHCGAKFYRKTDLVKHFSKLHEGKDSATKMFRCEFCNCKTATKNGLQKHNFAVHGGETKVERKDYSEKHVATVHKGKKPTKKKKPSQISEKKHNDTTVHEEKKFIKCDICDFSSELNIDLKNHMSSIHGGIKQFICVICDGSFELKIKLQTHIESVHGKKVSLDSL